MSQSSLLAPSRQTDRQSADVSSNRNHEKASLIRREIVDRKTQMVAEQEQRFRQKVADANRLSEMQRIYEELKAGKKKRYGKSQFSKPPLRSSFKQTQSLIQVDLPPKKDAVSVVSSTIPKTMSDITSPLSGAGQLVVGSKESTRKSVAFQSPVIATEEAEWPVPPSSHINLVQFSGLSPRGKGGLRTHRQLNLHEIREIAAPDLEPSSEPAAQVHRVQFREFSTKFGHSLPENYEHAAKIKWRMNNYWKNRVQRDFIPKTDTRKSIDLAILEAKRRPVRRTEITRVSISEILNQSC